MTRLPQGPSLGMQLDDLFNELLNPDAFSTSPEQDNDSSSDEREGPKAPAWKGESPINGA